MNEIPLNKVAIHPTLKAELIAFAVDIYSAWANGFTGTADAFLKQVPPPRVPYIVMLMTSMAFTQDRYEEFYDFILEITQ